MAKRLYIMLYNPNTGDSLTLPVNPENIDISTERDVATYNILNFGEVPVVKYKKLQTITLTSFYPDDTSYFALLASLVEKLTHKPYTKEKSVTMIEKWAEEGKPIRVIISGDTHEDINKEFIIQKFNKQLRESTPNITGTIELIEYKNPEQQEQYYKNPRTKLGNKIVSLIPRPIRKYIPEKMVVEKGETLYKIAKRIYGDAAGKSEKLAELNNIFDRNKDLAGEIIDMLPLD